MASCATAITVVGLIKYRPQPQRLWDRITRKTPALHPVLNDVSLRIETGSVVALLGENGAGKTTLLKIITGLAMADGGQVAVNGRAVYCGAADRTFYYRLSVRENLRFFAALDGLAGAAAQSKIQETLKIVDLWAERERNFGDLSSGMRQRVALARALLSDPDIIAFDEPTRAVDPTHTHTLHEFILNILVRQQQKTILVATNVLAEARTLAAYALQINAGRLETIAHADI